MSEENKNSIIDKVAPVLSKSGREYFIDALEMLDTDNEDVEFAITVVYGCLIVRVFDVGHYVFLFPYELEENASVHSAIIAVSEYAMREEVPLVFSDVDAESLSCFSGFRHMNVDADDQSCDSYRVEIKTECMLAEKIPDVTGERVKLNEICDTDVSAYAELCKDENVNKYWGYDYKNDVKNPSDSYFYEVAVREFRAGIAATMAIRVDGEFAGEATIYAFDGRGGAEFAIRLLPRWQGMGFGTEATVLILDAARALGLIRLHAVIMNENTVSIAMFKKFADSLEVGMVETKLVIELEK